MHPWFRMRRIKFMFSSLWAWTWNTIAEYLLEKEENFYFVSISLSNDAPNDRIVKVFFPSNLGMEVKGKVIWPSFCTVIWWQVYIRLKNYCVLRHWECEDFDRNKGDAVSGFSVTKNYILYWREKFPMKTKLWT